jgi:phage-related minor tail protein
MATQETDITKEDLTSFKEEIIQQFHVSTEGIRDEVKQVAEGVDVVDKKLERTRQELKEEIDNKTQPIAHGIMALDKKVTALDAKVDGIHLEIKTEIQETRQEVLAAVKFSYAELDKRLTTLEQEFLDLKLRVEKIENRSSV